MDLPWVSGDTDRPAADVTVMASRFQLTSVRYSVAFLITALRIVGQAKRSEGLLGMTLRAHPLRAEFWTLSVWTGTSALRDFARANPHRDTMRRFRPQMKSGILRDWTAPGDVLDDIPALWREGERRISE
jgi:hypothetical protein